MRGLLLSLPARDPEERHRAATQLELLFDLVSVIAIAAVTAGLHHAISEGHGLEKLPAFVFLFTAIWWAWMNFTWFASAFDSDGPGYRLLVMLIMVGALIFAGGAEHIFETAQLSWGVVGWTVMRLGMAALWLRASANPEYRITAHRYAIGIVVAQALWIWFSFAVAPGSLAFFGWGILIFLVEFSVPPVAERARVTPFHRHHIIERYGLLTIISLGEVLLAVSLGFGALYGGEMNGQVAITAFSAFVVAFAIFWIYFCEREHLPERKLSTALVWGYAHVFVFGAIALLGAAVGAELDLITHHSHATREAVSWWLGAPLAVLFVAIWVTRDRHFALGARGFALPLGAIGALGVAWAGAPAWAFAGLTVLVLLWRTPLRSVTDPRRT
jgi:low temperature requirement protein LtrA